MGGEDIGRDSCPQLVAQRDLDGLPAVVVAITLEDALTSRREDGGIEGKNLAFDRYSQLQGIGIRRHGQIDQSGEDVNHIKAALDIGSTGLIEAVRGEVQDIRRYLAY